MMEYLEERLPCLVNNDHKYNYVHVKNAGVTECLCYTSFDKDQACPYLEIKDHKQHCMIYKNREE